MKRIVLSILIVLCASTTARGLKKEEVLVVYNARDPISKRLAGYYVARRKIPRENVLAVRTVTTEDIERREYYRSVRDPIMAFLEKGERKKRIKCIVLMRGIPLRVGQIDDLPARKARNASHTAWKAARTKKQKLEAERKTLQSRRRKTPAILDRIRELDGKLAEVEREMQTLDRKYKARLKTYQDIITWTNASVDSELAVMFWKGATLDGDGLVRGDIVVRERTGEREQTWRWVPNALFYRFWKHRNRDRLPKTLMVCRLDGATEALVRRIIDDSVAVEKTGLRGTAYVDARGLRTSGRDSRAPVIAFDELIGRTAKFLKTTGIKTVFDGNEPVFQPGSAPDAALYCGWYSLMRYIPAFKWNRGAVAMHIASGEARTLRNGGKPVWCKRMIDEGVAATYGPVWEPFIHTFPNPKHFFAFLLTGEYTVAEAFWYTKPVNSWMHTLIADPLYRPFRVNPKLTIKRMREVLKQ